MSASDPLSDTLGRAELRPLSRALLFWYGRAHRSLPWRARPGRLPDPYHVLVSEAMLQQTRVATVVGYFERFLDAFPTVEALAAAEEQDVLRLWQGLGYYRRARHLHRAAQRIVEQHGGRVPDRLEDLLALPGVGRYTAGAIASIAHGQPEPVVDGNVARVVGRWRGLEQPTDEPKTREALWAAAKALHEASDPAVALDAQQNEETEPSDPPPAEDEPATTAQAFTPGDLNQAVMELGARICTAKAPSCLLCPVQPWCVAARTGEPEAYPPPRRRPSQRPVTHRIIAVRRGNRRLFVRRPDEGLWAGLWQLPTLEGEPGPATASGTPSPDNGRRSGSQTSMSPGDTDETTAGEGLAEWVREHFRLRIGRPTLTGMFEHQTTHRRIRFEVWEAAVEAGRLRPGSGVWRRPDRVDDLPLANPQHRALRLIAGEQANQPTEPSHS
jgi:A/G-specific adenine glycosylase